MGGRGRWEGEAGGRERQVGGRGRWEGEAGGRERQVGGRGRWEGEAGGRERQVRGRGRWEGEAGGRERQVGGRGRWEGEEVEMYNVSFHQQLFVAVAGWGAIDEKTGSYLSRFPKAYMTSYFLGKQKIISSL